MTDLDLGVVGNSAIAALIDGRGRIVWSCFPRLDGDPVFHSLLGASAQGDEGVFEIDLQGFKRSERRYWPNTAILETILESEDGSKVRIVDFVPRFKMYGRLFRPGMLMRSVEPLVGSPMIRVRIRPSHDYGRERAETTRGSNTIRYHLGEQTLRLTTDGSPGLIRDEVPFILERPLTLILGPDETLPEAPATLFGKFCENTEDYWREWVRYLAIPFEWQDVVIRAAITLKLCAYEETGGIVAALTTSVPEYGASGRTWDYRYCWLRDSFFTVRALNRLGATRTMEDYISYVSNVVARNGERELQPLFGLQFEAQLHEEIVPALPGYRGFGPVRRGNDAFRQRQNDGYGSVVLAISQCFFDERLIRKGDVALFERLEGLGEHAARLWAEPDAGLWEYRTLANVHTHSSAMCWAACDRLARIAGRLGLPDRAVSWREKADLIRDGIFARGWNAELGTFVSRFGGDDVDASLLLLADIGLVDAEDPRFVSTVDFIGQRLRHGAHLFRYAGEDDFGEPETAFTICTLWYIEALAKVGRREEARVLFEDVLGRRNGLGLLSEGIHVESGELWGNFPQTYSMVGLIHAALSLSASWEDAF
ncbi:MULTISPECIES: glycoside hydrolase family 15 protein [Chelatococcus]|uniref:GH15 family glucan-1,4-alpha-glucosidase n=1 Tax=Chelatococcus caeni TaxID=1348468 RepID=A0A840BUG5_9HYPH|nr:MULTISPECIES: glycoside hydrolase family 15 protein [Chelatococcus]ALA17207.1 glucoamylase [Chelatococcus sp. CO-6]MBB4017025.1 GH15 family glucan-1,4-alpha-glucosidase [Chelatococcus caeni]